MERRVREAADDARRESEDRVRRLADRVAKEAEARARAEAEATLSQEAVKLQREADERVEAARRRAEQEVQEKVERARTEALTGAVPDEAEPEAGDPARASAFLPRRPRRASPPAPAMSAAGGCAPSKRGRSSRKSGIPAECPPATLPRVMEEPTRLPRLEGGSR